MIFHLRGGTETEREVLRHTMNTCRPQLDSQGTMGQCSHWIIGHSLGHGGGKSTMDPTKMETS